MSPSRSTCDQTLPSDYLRRRDEGSVLPMILALMVVGSLSVVALLTFATTLFTNRPPIEERDRTFWTAKSAMSMAMTLQREYGPDGCYPGPYAFTLNGFTANVTCTPTGNYFGTGRGRFAVITTSNAFAANQLTGSGAGAAVKPIVGDVLVNGGAFGATSADLGVRNAGSGVAADVLTSSYTSTATPAARYNDPTVVPTTPPAPPATPVATNCTNPAVPASMTFPNPGTAWSTVCQAQPWWELAGDLNSGGTYDYPELPPLPAYLRLSVPQATIGSCNVYFPGRYSAPLTLGAGSHFFPSGVYYFEDVVTLAPGAEVVAGEGRWAGCTFDAEAAFAPNSPNFHAITGKGATFVLGNNGRIVSNNASLRINRRVSDSTSRGTETVAIRSVNFRSSAPTGVAPVEIPDDIVYLADLYNAANSACDATLSTVKCLQRAINHTVRPTMSAPIASYTASRLTPNETIISIGQTGGTANSNQFVTDGYIFVPNSRVAFNGAANNNYRLRVSAGIVASSVQFAYGALPSTAANWFVGVLDEPIQRQVELFASVTAPNGLRTESRAIMEINVDESYAINGWTVDPNVGTATPTAPPTTTIATIPPTTIPPTTIPPTTTTTIPPTTTTSTTTTTIPPTTTTTTTTIPPTTTTTIPCPAAQTSWAGQYWNDSSPADRLVGTPDFTRTDAAISFDWGNGSPGGTIGINNFSVRWTRDVGFTQAGTYRFTARGDDGMRLFITNNTTGARTMVSPVDAWRDQAARSYTFDVPLTACTHRLEFEFYENGGQASAQLSWVRL